MVFSELKNGISEDSSWNMVGIQHGMRGVMDGGDSMWFYGFYSIYLKHYGFDCWPALFAFVYFLLFLFFEWFYMMDGGDFFAIEMVG